jgi:SAM-dependent methyltransferase
VENQTLLQQRIFDALHGDLPREGPGSLGTAMQALTLTQPLPDDAKVLDIGCGTGAQTVDLATLLPNARITALDCHAPFLRALERKAAARGFAERLDVVRGDMNALAFEPASFDLIWCQGAAYVIGFERALREWRCLLKPNGMLAIAEPVWLRNDAPTSVRDFWSVYPAMRNMDSLRKIAAECNYFARGDLIMKPEDWWDEYYTPLSRKIDDLRISFIDNPEAQFILDDHFNEIGLYAKYADFYGYAFFVLESI